MDFEYVDSDKFQSPKLRLVRDQDGRLFVRKNTQIDAELSEKLKSISSPYIVKFIEFGEDEDGAYVIEEYIDGVTAAEQTLKRKQAVRALIELCDALNVLHSAKIIHRDIKPSNLIITADGHIRLIDFDASRIAKTVKDKDTQILGTEGFAPPEQFGFSQTDSRSDIYSFGVTMKLLLGDNAAQFGSVIKKCKALDPEERYQSIVQVKTAIRLASLKRLALIPMTAAFLAVFTLIILAVLEQRNTVDYIDNTSSESYESSTASHESSFSLSAGSSSEPSSTHLVSSVPQSESSGSITENSDSSQSSEMSTSTTSSQKPESTEPSESSTSSQSTQNSEPSESSASSQSSQSSEPSESSTSSESSQSSEPPESSTSSQSSVSSDAPASDVIIEVPEPFVLHRSDSDNPNKITFTTRKNDDGYYEDVCSYRFYDDPTVYGEWESVGTIIKDDLRRWASGKKNLTVTEPWLRGIILRPDGTARIEYNSWRFITSEELWTNGYLIIDHGESQRISELFTVTSGGRDFLVIENKNGDYSRNLEIRMYFILVKIGDQ